MKKFLSIDIGGTWLKAALFDKSALDGVKTDFEVVRVPSNLSCTANGTVFDAILQAVNLLKTEIGNIAAIGISTAGIVNYQGSCVTLAAKHLTALCNPEWKKQFEERFNVPCAMINDADAALIAAVKCGYISPDAKAALLAVGTGLGCAVLKESHRYRPSRELTLLGSVRTPAGRFDELASAVNLAKLNRGDLAGVFRRESAEFNRYLDSLSQIIVTAGIIYDVDEVILTGGLAAAAQTAETDLAELLNQRLFTPPERRTPTLVTQVVSWNMQLFGAGLLAAGIAGQPDFTLPPVVDMPTEKPLFKDLELTDLSTEDLAERLFTAENEAAQSFAAALPGITATAEKIAENLPSGGRIIYVGAGTSGRLAAVDAVELPCTYGIKQSQAVALVAGGNNEAALTIEHDNEEDASCVPELLLLNLTAKDVVIGISASGSAFYVRSALAYAKSCGAVTVMMQESAVARQETDILIALASGAEIVAGSTRMKAGTATKKALNFITTIAMIKLGKTRNSLMVNLQALNAKLRRRQAGL